MIFSAAELIATLELMQAMVTVWAGTETGKPELIAASRAIFDVLDSWITVPYMI